MVKSCLNEGGGLALGPRSIKNKVEKIKNETDFYEKTPFLTIAKELLMLIKENKVEQIIFLSAYNKRDFANGDPRKKKTFSETFENVPNCDIVIDDNPNILTNVLKENKKITALAPYYSPTIKHHQNVLLVKTSLIEDLKDALKLLEDQKGKQLDNFGDPIILETGLCSLVDSYQSEEEENEDI
ncbi:452_t:CDS:2 [Ambispora leptoticha]|uniref:452_t:CDS:1 n=1 Tax=Ambispora leptoticha TaxID=144679 RepID=A0A9N8Z8D1_9GLOM|nr:452_t:CDS:2 [Ambispora leptoticha]